MCFSHFSPTWIYDVMGQVVPSHHWQLKQLAVEISHFNEGLPILLIPTQSLLATTNHLILHRWRNHSWDLSRFPPTPACIAPQHPPWHWFGPKDPLPARWLFSNKVPTTTSMWSSLSMLDLRWAMIAVCMWQMWQHTQPTLESTFLSYFGAILIVWCRKGKAKRQVSSCVCVCHSSCKSQRSTANQPQTSFRMVNMIDYGGVQLRGYVGFSKRLNIVHKAASTYNVSGGFRIYFARAKKLRCQIDKGMGRKRHEKAYDMSCWTW